jgi:hypothetical protein
MGGLWTISPFWVKEECTTQTHLVLALSMPAVRTQTTCQYSRTMSHTGLEQAAGTVRKGCGEWAGPLIWL